MSRGRPYDRAMNAHDATARRFGGIGDDPSHATQTAWLAQADLWDDVADVTSGAEREAARRLAQRIRSAIANATVRNKSGAYDVQHAGSGRRGYETRIAGFRVTLQHSARSGWWSATVHLPSGRSLPGGTGADALDAEASTRRILKNSMPRS